MTVVGVGVVEPGVVLAQEIPVVVPVRRADHRVDVVPRRRVVVERNTPLVIELDEDHRAVDSVVEDDSPISRYFCRPGGNSA